jgi:hypothetical protein
MSLVSESCLFGLNVAIERLENHGFKSRLTWMTFFLMFLRASSQVSQQHIKLFHDLPHSHPKTFFSSVLRGDGGCSMPIPCCFTPGEKSRSIHCTGGCVDPGVGLDLWSVGSRYTDYANLVPYYKLITLQLVLCRLYISAYWALLLQSVIQPTAS